MNMEIELYQLIILALVGVVGGWMNVMAGGGSLLTVPAMLFMGIPAPVANGTNRIGIIMQNIAAVYGFFRKGFSDFKLSLSLAAFAGVGAVAGAYVGIELRGAVFNYLLAVVMILVMIMMSIKTETKIDNPEGKHTNLLLGHFLMIFAGFWGGMIQIGVGFILMPILNKVMKFDLVRTNMYKVFIALSYSFIAIYIFSTEVGILLEAGLALGIGSMIGGYIGSQTAVVKGEKWIKIVLQVTLTLFIIKLLFF